MDLYLFLGFLVLLGVWAVLIYNRLIALKNRCSNAFAQIEVQLKRRYDLIPNLVESAKAAMAHERETLEAVITARNQAQAGLEQAAANPEDGAALSALSAAEGVLGKALDQFRVTLEAYPDLKTNQNMMQLTETLESTENKVAFARQAFNDQIMAYNTYRAGFPAVILANNFGHPQDLALLEFEDSAAIQAAPKLSF
jgi:LemA protein